MRLALSLPRRYELGPVFLCGLLIFGGPALEAVGYFRSRMLGDWMVLLALVLFPLATAYSLKSSPTSAFLRLVALAGVTGLLAVLNLLFLRWLRVDFLHAFEPVEFTWFETAYEGVLAPASILIALLISAFTRRQPGARG